jgi:hypothetical protein
MIDVAFLWVDEGPPTSKPDWHPYPFEFAQSLTQFEVAVYKRRDLQASTACGG